MQQAMLPESLEEVTLKDLMNGEDVWVVPWAMYADDKGRLWLNGGYPFHHDYTPDKTPQMKVSKNNGEYTCDVSLCRDHGWPKGSGWTNGLPVSKVIGQV